MKRNFANLTGGSAAAVNSGTIGIQKDRVGYFDPTAEIYYDAAENVRNGEVVDDDIQGLIALRLAMDAAEQLQPIRLYPLPAEKLNPQKPAMKYGVGYGHRRMLACRLTKKDHPSIGEMPRKVAAIIDVEWLNKGRAYRLKCQIQENTHRVDLNFVELGQAIHSFRNELEKEESRKVPQRELQEIFDIPEKTLGNLVQAAEFHHLTKTACNRKVLTDLDSLVTFDSICRISEEFAQAIYNSLLDENAPRTRTLIRQAKATIEAEPSFKVDPDTWVWPDSVAALVKKPTPAPAANLALVEQPKTQSRQNAGADGVDAEGGTGAGSQLDGVNVDANSKNEPRTPQQAGNDAPALNPVTSQAKAQPAAPEVGLAQANGHSNGSVHTNGADSSAKGLIIMVSFKMGAEAKEKFTGELLLDRKAKVTSSGVVAYLNEGREETIEVPLKHVELLSISN